MRCPRSNMHYRLSAKLDEPFATRLRDLAAERPRFGWRRLQTLEAKLADSKSEYIADLIRRDIAKKTQERSA